jgi:hypothetical protein
MTIALAAVCAGIVFAVVFWRTPSPTVTVERANIAGWVGSLERAFDLKATEEPDRIVIRAR